MYNRLRAPTLVLIVIIETLSGLAKQNQRFVSVTRMFGGQPGNLYRVFELMVWSALPLVIASFVIWMFAPQRIERLHNFTPSRIILYLLIMLGGCILVGMLIESGLFLPSSSVAHAAIQLLAMAPLMAMINYRLSREEVTE